MHCAEVYREYSAASDEEPRRHRCGATIAYCRHMRFISQKRMGCALAVSVALLGLARPSPGWAETVPGGARAEQRDRALGRGLRGWWRARRGVRRYHQELRRKDVLGHRLRSGRLTWKPRLVRVGLSAPAAILGAMVGPAALLSGWGFIASGVALVANAWASGASAEGRRELVSRGVRDLAAHPDPQVLPPNAQVRSVLLERDAAGKLRFEEMVARYAPDQLEAFREAAARTEKRDAKAAREIADLLPNAPKGELSPAQRLGVMSEALERGLASRGPIALTGATTLEQALFRHDAEGKRPVFDDMVRRDAYDRYGRFRGFADDYHLLSQLPSVPAVRSALGRRDAVERRELLETALKVAKSGDAATRKAFLSVATSEWSSIFGWPRPAYEGPIRRYAPELLEPFLAEANKRYGEHWKPETPGIIWGD